MPGGIIATASAVPVPLGDDSPGCALGEFRRLGRRWWHADMLPGSLAPHRMAGPQAARHPVPARAPGRVGPGEITGCLLGGRGLAAAVAAAAAAAGPPGWWRCGRCRCRWRLGADGAAGGSDEFAAGGVAVGRVFGQRLTDDLIDGAGRVGCSELGVVGISSTCAQMTAASTSLAKGTRPVTHSYITQPSE